MEHAKKLEPVVQLAGYRELTHEEVSLINEVKETGETLRRLLHKIDTIQTSNFLHLIEHQDRHSATAHAVYLANTESHRWRSMAKDSFQVGMMQLVRAVAKPTNF